VSDKNLRSVRSEPRVEIAYEVTFLREVEVTTTITTEEQYTGQPIKVMGWHKDKPGVGT